jgi:flagellar motor switch protein FliN
MSWESLYWRPAATVSPDAANGLADVAPVLQSAIDEAAAAYVQGGVSVTELLAAELSSSGLPDGLASLASIQLQGAERRLVMVGLSPTAGSELNGQAVDALGLGRAILDALDGGLAELAGDGLSPGDPSAASYGDSAPIVLFRASLTDAAGATVQLVVVVDAALPGEIATHVTTLRALANEAAMATADAAHDRRPEVVGAVPEASAPAVSEPPAPDAPSGATGAPSASHDLPPLPPNTRPLVLDELPLSGPVRGVQDIELLLGVSLQVTVEIGRTRLPIREVLALTPGSIVELDKLAGEKVDVLVNGHRIASGEVVVVDDNFGVRITDVVSRQRRILSADAA